MYQIIIGLANQYPFITCVTSTTNLIDEYKNCVIGKKTFLTWENGCIEMKNVLGVFCN